MELAYTDCQEKAETHREQLQSSAKLDACYILGFVQKQMIKRSAEVHINVYWRLIFLLQFKNK